MVPRPPTSSLNLGLVTHWIRSYEASTNDVESGLEIKCVASFMHSREENLCRVHGPVAGFVTNLFATDHPPDYPTRRSYLGNICRGWRLEARVEADRAH